MPGNTFAAGDLVAGRYHIVRFVARGGMGEVYEAEDRELGGKVALKTVRSEAAHHPRTLARFRREIHLARRITHPNVSRIYDVGRHQAATEITFLTMELLAGEPLSQRIARGRLLLGEAQPLVEQMAAALGAAHDLGIIHRDFKSSNVMLEPHTGPGHPARAVVTDFGLARLESTEDGEVSISERRQIVGSPAYMAPEQLEGEVLTPAADIYSLGIVLYEMVAGVRPFGGGPALAVAMQRLSHAPSPPSAFVADLDPQWERVILKCLERDPHHRFASASEVAAALRANAAPAQGAPVPRGAPAPTRVDPVLRAWPPPEPPEHPYPVLLPYEHPDLLAGRDRDVATLARLLRSPLPILGLAARSGTGKSSLLLAGLVPRLRGDGRAVAIERHPSEPGLVARLIGDLLEWPAEEEVAVADDDAESFVAWLERCGRLAGSPPVLVLDQFEDVLVRADAAPLRARLGLLLAATCRPRPGTATPPCRWLLAYREEYLGKVGPWLADVTAEARRAGLSAAAGLPHDVSGPERFENVPLSPLGTPSGGSREPIAEASAVFQAAIEAPLALRLPDGSPRYPWRFVDGGAARLARAFAEARVARPEAPLAPELQVVLAHLLAGSDSAPSATIGSSGETAIESSDARPVEVPEEPGELVDRALEEHLRRAMEAAFPAGRHAPMGRARALLALRELASATGALQKGRPAAEIERAIGADGPDVLERLAAADARLVLRQEGPDGPRWVLSHDRMAEAIVRLVDEEGRGGGFAVDAELLALRRLVSLKSSLHRAGEAAATRLPGRVHRQIERSAEALLWNEARQSWWAACRRRRRVELTRSGLAAALATLLLLAAGLGLTRFVQARAARAALLEQVEEGDPPAAFAALDQGVGAGEIAAAELLSRLRRRPRPFDVFEFGMGGVGRERRAEAVMRVAELVFPLLAEAPQDNERLASLLWALDYAARAEARARELRDRALAPLRAARPPRAVSEAEWVEVPAGTYWMGTRPEELDDVAPYWIVPRHRVTLSAFRILDHEVTVAEYRLLVPDHDGDDDLPVTRVTWFDAYVYAAWLGGRLPTEAEWMVAAREGCEHTYCTEDGREATRDEVAWWEGNSAGPDGMPRLHPVRSLKPNQRGLYDIYGNASEWIADWHTPAELEGDPIDPAGPPSTDVPVYRRTRGFAVSWFGRMAHPSARGNGVADLPWPMIGLRPVRAARD